MSKKQKQNPKSPQTKQVNEKVSSVMSLLDFAKYMETEEGRPQPETIPDPILHLRSLFGMNRDDTIAFAERVDDLLKLSRQQLRDGAMEEQEQTHLELLEMYNQKRSQGELRKAALSSSGFLTHREAFDAMGAGFGNHAKSIKQTYGPSGSTAAGSTAVVNQENTPPWWQQKREEEQQRQEQMEIHSVPYRTDKRGNPGEERRLAATRIQAIQRRKSSAKKEQKLREEQQQKKGGRKSRGRRRSRKKRKSRKPKKRRKRNKRKSRKR